MSKPVNFSKKALQRSLSLGHDKSSLGSRANYLSEESSFEESDETSSENNVNASESSSSSEPQPLPKGHVWCKVCDKSFFRSNKSKHDKTKHHQLHLAMNTKIRNLLLR